MPVYVPVYMPVSYPKKKPPSAVQATPELVEKNRKTREAKKEKKKRVYSLTPPAFHAPPTPSIVL